MRRALIAFAFVFASRTAFAEPCGARTWIAVHADSLLESKIAAHVVSELRADLSAQGIDVCESDGTTPAAARISIVLANGLETVSIRIAVRDAVTAKDLSRTIDTSKIPPEGRALVIALATEELLRASWAEIAIPEAPPPAIPVPKPVARIVGEMRLTPTAPPRRASVVLGFEAVSDAFTTGLFRFGGDVRAGVELGRRVAIFAHGGFRRSPSIESTNGVVDADTILAGVDFAFALVPHPSRAGVDLTARLDLARITFHGVPHPGIVGASATLTSLEASFGARARYSITPAFDAFVAASGGFPIVAANARDGDVTVASTAGALVTASAGVMGRFR